MNKGHYTGQRYTSEGKNVVNLYTKGLGEMHPITQHFKVISCPRPVLIGKDGKLFTADVSLLRYKGLESLVAQIIKIVQQYLKDYQSIPLFL